VTAHESAFHHTNSGLPTPHWPLASEIAEEGDHGSM
jgi:hypothetical protein